MHERQTVEQRLIGNSETMRAVRRMIERVAPTDSTVLIRGENGCGKELVAGSRTEGHDAGAEKSTRTTWWICGMTCRENGEVASC